MRSVRAKEVVTGVPAGIIPAGPPDVCPYAPDPVIRTVVVMILRSYPRTVRRALAAAASLFVLGTLAFADTTPSPQALEGVDASEAVELANSWKGEEVTSFATSRAVHFEFPGGAERLVAMPEDVMLVSVAPYVSQTHPCTTHFFSSCQGELAGAPVDVRATLTDGTVVLDETITTGSNGFLDLWLPREQGVVLDLALGGRQTQGFLTTFADSATCVTTLQLRR